MLRTGLLAPVYGCWLPSQQRWPSAPASDDDLKMSVETLKARNQDLERRLTELEARLGEGAGAQRASREEINALVKQAMADAKQQWSLGWLDNLKFSGDLRLRYEYRDRTDNDQKDSAAGCVSASASTRPGRTTT